MHNLSIRENLEESFVDVLLEPTIAHHDALIARFKNGVTLEIRYPQADEYSILWRWNDAMSVIDTAPLHRELSSFPNHFHDSAGILRADPLTDPALDPWDNVRAVVLAVLENPQL